MTVAVGPKLDLFAAQTVARRSLYGLPDPLAYFQVNPVDWIETHLVIRTKRKTIEPFLLNEVQQRYFRARLAWDIILKARQVGITTASAAWYFADTLLHENTVTVLVAHDRESTRRIFEMVKRFWQFLPDEEKDRVGEPLYSTRTELVWDRINSSFFVGTAGSERAAFGKGFTINNLHASEVAVWPRMEEALTALLEAIPDEGSATLESTAFGMANPFHTRWVESKDGRSEFRPHFFPWWLERGYTIEADPPLGALDEEEKALREVHGLTNGQIRWRRLRKVRLRDRFPQEYPENDIECFLTTGRGAFDAASLLARSKLIAAEDTKKAPTRIRALNDGQKGAVSLHPATLWAWKYPVNGRKYVIGADTSEGVQGGDSSAACIVDYESGEQVAELHGLVAPEKLARFLDLLGRWYNLARVGVERNNHGHSVLNSLRNFHRYRRLYYHRAYDRTGKQRPMLGWPTDSKTKPIMVDEMAAAIVTGTFGIRSSELCDELLGMVVTDTGSVEASEGKHDDRAIAAMIAWQLRQRPIPRASTERPEGW